MAATEALRIQLDALRIEVQQLQVHNRRLREENPEEAQAIDLCRELEKCEEENQEFRKELEELRRCCTLVRRRARER